jgi:membrane peptidoglycan carboxypeptidase
MGIMKKIGVMIGGFFLLIMIILSIYIITLFGELPDIHSIENLHVAQSTVIYDRSGNRLYTIHGEENRKYIPLRDIADFVKQATIATEDKDFYKHPGFDLMGMIRSAVHNVLHPGEKLRSGSTITQQLVKIIFLSPEQTLRRKLKEIILAYELEQTYDKDKILELYLNQIPYGSNAYGIEMAAQTYFGKSAKDLTLIESAILASLPKGPTYYSPYGQNKKLLMGYCTTDSHHQEGTSEFSSEHIKSAPLVLHLKATSKVYVKINIDQGKEKQEMIMKTGEEKDITAMDSVGFLLGNKNSVEISFQGFAFKPFVSKSFVVTAATVRDFLATPDAWDQKILAEQEQQIKGACTGMDDPNYVDGRKDYVLRRMQEDGYITKEQRDAAWKEGQHLQFKKYVVNIKYPHFVMYVRDYLEQKYGQEMVEKGGLQVTTTIDPKLQDLAQRIIDDHIDRLEKQYKMSNMALVSANPQTGQILAMIGSRDYWNEKYDGNVNIALARRQPGSSFKPFIYAAAFQQGYGAGTVLWDVKTQFGKGTPPNNADGAFLGPMTIRKALAWSRNIPAIKAFYLAGEEDKLVDFLAPFGFDYLRSDREEARKTNPDYSYGWPMAIGSVEVRMLDMVQGYAIFANGGMKKELTPILEVRDKDGNILEQYNDHAGKEQVLDPQIAYLINNILSDVQARPEGYWRDRITVPNQYVAVKTGTSNKRVSKNLIFPSDNWTIGYSTTLVTGMWGGNSDGSPMTGSAFDINTIASLWKNYMTQALKDTPAQNFPVPDGIVHATVNRLSGKLVTQNTPDAYRVTDIFPSFGVPKELDDSIQKIKIDSRNNLLATDDCPPVVVQEKIVLNVHETIQREGWDAAIISWLNSHTDAFPDIIFTVPKENSPLCVPISDEQKPTITILSPLSYGQVTKGTVNVFVQTTAFFGVDRVEYYLDHTLVYTSKQKPYTGIVHFVPESATGSVHTITAVVYDKNQYMAEGSVYVTLTDTDTTPPHVSFLSPSDGANIPLHSSLVLQAEAYDDNSSVKRVDYYLDDHLIATSSQLPFQATVFLARDQYTEGTHHLKAQAVDLFGNKQSAIISVLVTAPITTETSFDIIQPVSGTTVAKGESIPIQFVVKGKNIKTVDVLARRSDGVSSLIQSFSELSKQAETFVSSWTPDQSGSYELFLKVLDTAGVLSYSNRVSITVP